MDRVSQSPHLRRTSLRETTRAIVSDAFRDLRGSWRALALTDLAYKLVSFALLTPATLLLLRWAMARTGTAVVADVEIASFFLTTRPGILSLILGGAILTGITALEMACLMAILSGLRTSTFPGPECVRQVKTTDDRTQPARLSFRVPSERVYARP